MRVHHLSGRLLTIPIVALLIACGPGGSGGPSQPAASGGQPPAAQPAKPAASAPEPAKPAQPATQPDKPSAPAAQPARPAAGGDEPDPALVEAAKKEGKLAWYTSLELSQAKKMGELFEKKYGIPVEVVRNGSEKVFAQFMKEQSSNVRKADVVHTSDASNYLTMNASGYLVAYRAKAADSLAPELKTQVAAPDNTWFALRISPWVMAYNSNKVKEPDAPKAWKDLLDPKWKGKLVHSHPGYSGSTLTVVHLLTTTMPDYYKQLAKNEPLIVQSAVDVPTKVISGEADVAAGTLQYNVYREAAKGNPVKTIFPTDGSPLIVSPQGIAKSAPNPNAAKLFQEWSLGREAQQFLAEDGGLHTIRNDVKLPQGQIELSKLKLTYSDAEALEKAREDILKQFKDNFGV